MGEAKVISVCPVCQSTDIIQEIDYGAVEFELVPYGKGSHCGNCGIRFFFNSMHLQEELDEINAKLKQHRAKRAEKEAKRATKSWR